MSQSWRASLLAVVAVVAILSVFAGRWQLRRLGDRRARNQVAVAAQSLPPVDIGHTPQLDTSIAGRRVVGRGTFDTSTEILLRSRFQNDGPGIQVVTPLQLDGSDAVVWVLRGFVPSPDAVTPPADIPVPAPGVVTISGLAVAAPSNADSGRPLRRTAGTTWMRLDRGTMQALRPTSLAVYVLLGGDTTGPGHLDIVPPPALGNGPHLSYALQWFGIATVAVVFGAIVMWRGDRAQPRPDAAP